MSESGVSVERERERERGRERERCVKEHFAKEERAERGSEERRGRR